MVYEKGKKYYIRGTCEGRKIYYTKDSQPKYVIKRLIGYREPTPKEIVGIRKKFGRLENIITIMTKDKK